jgi:hypothetical protein
MGIFDIDSGADNHLLNEQFHVFSKSPASVATALGDATNKSGHTVAASDVWAQKIPAFFYAKTTAAAEAFKPLAKVNDLCRIGNSISIFDGADWVHTYDTYGDIPDGHVFKNADGEGVVRFHKNRVAHLLTLDNNANDNGAGTTAKIQGWDVTAGEIDPETGKPTGAPYPYVETAPKFVSQFVTSTDNIVDGVPSKGYGPIVMVGTTTGDVTKALVEGTESAEHYVANSFAGIIQYNKTRDNDAVYVHAFEYCGKSVTDIATDLQTAIDNLDEIAATTGIKDVIAGDGIEVVKEGGGATKLTPIIKVTDAIATKTYADEKAEEKAAAAVADALEEGGSIAEAIATAKSEAIANAEVTITAGEGIVVTGESPGTTFEIAVADTIATKTYAEEKAAAAQAAAEATAAADATTKANAAQAAAEATAAGALSTARTEITAEIAAAKKEATDYTDAEVKKVADNLAATDKKHGEDIATVQAAIEALTTTGLTREIVSELPTTDIKLNTIYLVPDTDAEAGTYIEYLYVGELGEGATGSVENFEPIGSTKTDLSGYVTTEALNTTLEGYTTDAEHTALTGKVTALETLTAQHTTDIAAAQKAADDAQGEVDALEDVVAELTTTVGDNKKAAEDAIALKADKTALEATDGVVAGHTAALKTLAEETIPGITDRLDAIEEIPVVEVVHGENEQYITVSGNTADGKTTYTVTTTEALETRLDAFDTFVGEDGELATLLAAKVDNVTGSSHGVAISTADTETGRVATLTVTPGSVVTDNTSVVTGGAVAAAISSSAATTLESAEGYTDGQIAALKTALNAGDVTATNTSVTVTQTEGKVTAVTVTKGAVSEGDTDLVDGGTVFAVTNALDTRLAAVEQVATDLNTTIETAIGELDVTSHGSNGITFEQTNGKGAISVTADTEVKADSTNVVTSGAVATAISAAIEASEGKAAEAYAVKDTETVAANAAAAAKAADDKAVAAQGEVDALEGVVAELQQAHAADKAELDGEISALSQLITSLDGEVDGIDTRLTAAEGTIASLTEGENSVDSKIQTAISALNGGGNSAGVAVTQTAGVVTAVTVTPGSVADGNTSVVTGGAVYTAVKAVSDLIGDKSVATQISDAVAALDSTKTANGITVELTDGKVTTVSAAAGEVAENNTAVVTGGVVYTAVEAAKTLANQKIAAVEVATDATTHFGADHITATTSDDKKVTIAVTRADEWAWKNGFSYFANAAEVQNGKIINEDGTSVTYDSSNLTDGSMMFSYATKLTTFVDSLSKLTNGGSMFANCSLLTTFIADLGSLDKGDDMFKGCSLSAESLMYIADSIKDWGEGATGHNITIGVNALEFDMFGDKEEMQGYIHEIINKGWNVTLEGMWI